jgi:hypothetical protein
VTLTQVPDALLGHGALSALPWHCPAGHGTALA